MRNKVANQSGFTLMEILLVMITISTLLQIVIPNVRGILAEGHLTKVDGELNTLKSAIVSYWRMNNEYPSNITTDLTTATPQLLAGVMFDPFKTTGNTYGYQTGTDATFGPWFAVFSKGPKGDTTSVTFETVTQHVVYSGSGRVVSNAPVLRN